MKRDNGESFEDYKVRRANEKHAQAKYNLGYCEGNYTRSIPRKLPVVVGS